MESLHSLLRTHWDHEPLRLTEARSGPRVCDPQLARFMERPTRNKTSRIEPLNLVGAARCAVRAAFSGATMPPADSRARTSQRDVPTEVRFMESPLSLLRMHWDHEPPLTRPSATLSPSDGEREGVRGRFMERVADWPGDWKFMGFQLRLKLSQLSRPPPEKLIRQLSG